MSHKASEDKNKPNFPWTARQKRRKKGLRKVRKEEFGVMLRRKKKEVKK